MEFPRLVVASGSTQNAVQKLLDDMAKKHGHIEKEHHNPSHKYRGWSLLPANSITPVHTEIEEVKKQRPLWLVFTGQTRDWSGVAEGMMQVPAFANSMQRSDDVLRPFGIDLLHIANYGLPSDEFDLLAIFVVSTAMQVALVDVVRSLDIRVDGLFGISAGDFACGYADGALTSEQAVLASYWNARCMLDAPLEPAITVLIDLSWQKCAAKCPPGIKPTIQMDESFTCVTGPKKSVEMFAAELESTGIKTNHTADYAFHSDYLSAASPLLQSRLKSLIPDPKQRSAFWLSASLTRDCRETYTSTLCDASFYVHGMLSPVMVVDAVAEMPDDAIMVEVGPEPYFQPTLRQLKPSAVHIPLVHKDSVSPLHPLLSAIGRLYVAGANPKFSAIYP